MANVGDSSSSQRRFDSSCASAATIDERPSSGASSRAIHRPAPALLRDAIRGRRGARSSSRVPFENDNLLYQGQRGATFCPIAGRAFDHFPQYHLLLGNVDDLTILLAEVVAERDPVRASVR